MQLGAPLGYAITPWGYRPTFEADDRDESWVIVMDMRDSYHYMRVDSVQFESLG